jgi:hypothetical protein
MGMFVTDQGLDNSPLAPRAAPSERTRAARFARWERIGVELVRADLRNGGRFIVGAGPRTRALAEEWLRLKDAEKLKRASVQTVSNWEKGRALLKQIWTDAALRFERAFHGALHQH